METGLSQGLHVNIIYIYMYVYTMYIYIYMYDNMCIYLYTYIHIYIYLVTNPRKMGTYSEHVINGTFNKVSLASPTPKKDTLSS